MEGFPWVDLMERRDDDDDVTLGQTSSPFFSYRTAHHPLTRSSSPHIHTSLPPTRRPPPQLIQYAHTAPT